MNLRRCLLLALGASVSGRAAPLLAQTTTASPRRAGLSRIGILSFDGAPSATDPDPAEGFRRRLREHDYVEGQNIVVERRYAEGRRDRLAALAAELVKLKVDVILAGGPGPRDAARQATNSIPIVKLSGSDPVAEGWALSLARPGGNVTGLTVTFPELNVKRLELLKQAFPEVVRVAVLIEPTAAGDVKAFAQLVEAGIRSLGLQIQPIEVRGPDDIDAAFGLARQRVPRPSMRLPHQHHGEPPRKACRAGHGRQAAVDQVRDGGLLAYGTSLDGAMRAGALLVGSDVLFYQLREQVVALCVGGAMPASFDQRDPVALGGLTSYGSSLAPVYAQAGSYSGKILNGAKSADLPVLKPTKIEFVINQKTARVLGLSIPQSLPLRVDDVIQ